MAGNFYNKMSPSGKTPDPFMFVGGKMNLGYAGGAAYVTHKKTRTRLAGPRFAKLLS